MNIGTKKYTRLLKKESIGVRAICSGRRSVFNISILNGNDGITRGFLNLILKRCQGESHNQHLSRKEDVESLKKHCGLSVHFS